MKTLLSGRRPAVLVLTLATLLALAACFLQPVHIGAHMDGEYTVGHFRIETLKSDYEFDQMGSFPYPGEERTLSDAEQDAILSILPTLSGRRHIPGTWLPEGDNIAYPIPVSLDISFLRSINYTDASFYLVRNEDSYFILARIHAARFGDHWYTITDPEKLIELLSPYDPYRNDPFPKLNHTLSDAKYDPQPFQ